jgi:cephalosporin hydroxylase
MAHTAATVEWLGVQLVDMALDMVVMVMVLGWAVAPDMVRTVHVVLGAWGECAVAWVMVGAAMVAQRLR